MKIRPKNKAQESVHELSALETSMKNAAPMIGPINVPAPPTITMISTWPESSQNSSSVLVKPANGAYSAPAKPPSAKESEQYRNLLGILGGEKCQR